MSGGADLLFDDAESLAAALAGFEGDARLRTAPGAAARYGPLYLKVVVEGAVMPKGGHNPVIDCGDDAALAMRALAAGWRHVAFSGPEAMAEKLASMAAKQGARLERSVE